MWSCIRIVAFCILFAPSAYAENPYEKFFERGTPAEDVDQRRVSPPPALPELKRSTHIEADFTALVTDGYEPVGRSAFAGNVAPDSLAITQAKKIGADVVLLNTKPNAPDAAAKITPETRAYFLVKVKFQLGVRYRDMTAKELQQAGIDEGVVLREIVNGSPAASAGLQSGDAITSINGIAVPNSQIFRDRLFALQGQKVRLTASRNGASFDVDVDLKSY